MTLFYASLHNELKKIKSRRKFFVFLLLQILICAAWLGGSVVLSKLTGNHVSPALFLSGISMSMLTFVIQVYIPLIVFMAACDLFTGEVQDGSLRATFMRPVSRFKQYASKVVAIFIVAVLYLLALFVVTALIQWVSAGRVAGIGTALLSYLLDLVPLFVLVLFAAALNQFATSPSLSFMISLISYIVLMLLGMLVSPLNSQLFTSYLQWHNLWVGTAIPAFAMLPKIGILLGYALAFGGVGYYFFERREL